MITKETLAKAAILAAICMIAQAGQVPKFSDIKERYEKALEQLNTKTDEEAAKEIDEAFGDILEQLEKHEQFVEFVDELKSFVNDDKTEVGNTPELS